MALTMVCPLVENDNGIPKMGLNNTCASADLNIFQGMTVDTSDLDLAVGLVENSTIVAKYSTVRSPITECALLLGLLLVRYAVGDFIGAADPLMSLQGNGTRARLLV